MRPLCHTLEHGLKKCKEAKQNFYFYFKCDLLVRTLFATDLPLFCLGALYHSILRLCTSPQHQQVITYFRLNAITLAEYFIHSCTVRQQFHNSFALSDGGRVIAVPRKL